MNEVCSLLKETRQHHGLTLEEVAQRTYIKLPYLEALEEGILERLPAPVYTYGYIRQYAKLLGLDGSALVARFQQQERGPARASQRSLQPMADMPGDPFPPYKPSSNGFGRSNGKSHAMNGNGTYMVAEADAPEVRQAKMQAQQILTSAEREAEQIQRGAERYADEVLAELESEIGKTLQVVRNGRQFLQMRRQGHPGGM